MKLSAPIRMCAVLFSESSFTLNTLFSWNSKTPPKGRREKALDCEDFVLRACTYNGCKRY